MYLNKATKKKKAKRMMDSWDNLTDESKEAIYEARADRKKGKLKSYSSKDAVEFVKNITKE